MSAAVGAVIKQWMVPHLNAHKIRADVFEGNPGSVRVFEKNGFKLLESVRVKWPGPGGGRIQGMHVLEWERPRENEEVAQLIAALPGGVWPCLVAAVSPPSLDPSSAC